MRFLRPKAAVLPFRGMFSVETGWIKLPKNPICGLSAASRVSRRGDPCGRPLETGRKDHRGE